MQLLKPVMNLLLPCVILAVEAAAVAGSANQLRAPIHKAQPIMPDVALGQHASEHAVIPGLKSNIIPAEKNSKGQRLMDAISKFRAEVCYQMKVEHGMEFKTFKDCNKFMEDACKPGKDKLMDGDKKEVTSGEGYCAEYFPKAEKKAKEQVEKEDAEKPTEAPKAVPAPAPAPAPLPVAAAPAPAVVAAVPAPAPAGAPAGGPGPAPVPGPFRPGVDSGKPWGAIADDEAYYYAKKGKDPMRLHMSESMKLPTQGYWGKLVEHEDMKTSVDDWGHEFGPQAGHEKFTEICRQHPENDWCRQNGYVHRHHRSSSPVVSVAILPLVCAFAAIRIF